LTSHDLNRSKGSQRIEEPLFDIIVGTSIGAMNAAILVSNIVNRGKTWDNAVEQLESFWTDDKDGLSSNPDYSKWWENNKWWDLPGNDQNDVQSKEAARRYYSVKEYLTHGTPRVCTPPLIKGFDTKFGDQKDNLWFSHSLNSSIIINGFSVIFKPV
jgi:NTE family protein